MSLSVFKGLEGIDNPRMTLVEFRFPDCVGEIKEFIEGENWPVVYVIHNDKEAYIGETSSAIKRYIQHRDTKERNKLDHFCIVFDETFNKSAILDIENNLIQLMSSDRSYKLQNRNAGQSTEHNYYNRNYYTKKVERIWAELHSYMHLNSDYWALKNSDLYKYSPYIALTTEQTDVCNNVISDISDKLVRGRTGCAIISGGAGTGKTIVAINIIRRLLDAIRFKCDLGTNGKIIDEYGITSGEMFLEDMDVESKLHKMAKKMNNLSIGFVVPMKSMRKTMKVVFKSTNGKLRGCKVIGPSKVFDEKYDILFVDESHRLIDGKRPGQQYDIFRKKCNKLGLEMSDSSQMDWIIHACKYAVFFFDEKQTVRTTDVTKEHFDKIAKNALRFELTTQMRCIGGREYTEYLSSIFDCTQKERNSMSDGFELKLFDDVQDMVDRIKKLDRSPGLCRVVSGFAWEWKTKNMKHEDIINNHLFDIEIEGNKYIWNTTQEGWIMSKDAINEIGCVHTVQGFDLNYVGVIFGKEIDYDPISNKIIIDRKYFYDKLAKNGVTDKEMKGYSINAYKVLMTRGISGCYVYACNKNLREYLRRFF